MIRFFKHYTATHFQKLEMVVMGGDKGFLLTGILESVLADFSALFAKFAEGGYDVLNVAETRFDTDIGEFNTKIKELEQRLALAISEGFAGCGTLTSTFKMIDSFAEMFERDFVQADLENKQIDLIAEFSGELKQVQDMFTENRFRSYEGRFYEREGPSICTNMPPISGALAWVQGLMSMPMRSLQPVFVKLLHMDEVKDVITLHASIEASLKEYESEMYSAWGNKLLNEVTLYDDCKLCLQKLPALSDSWAASDGWSFNYCAAAILMIGRIEWTLSLIHISEPTRQEAISYAVFCLKKKKNHINL